MPGARPGDQVLGVVLELAPEHLDRRQRVAVGRRLVQAQARDPREPEREARLVPAAPHDHVEGDLHHDDRLHDPIAPVAGERVRLEPGSALDDLRVRQAAVRLPDRDELTRRVVPNGECVVGQDAVALAVAAFDAHHDAVQRRERLLHLQPTGARAGRARRRWRGP